ncbi:MAG: glycine cleavage system protein H [Verrucomicrobiales bacterium]|nr:glycine cleavage system protein H [Verrucomicrobiales bacterium]|tara:strand:- start:91 stop:477 length:387 start_codon:yes stop_codon:yes gene_type:complete
MSSEIPAELKFAKSHEWLRLDGEVGTVGISDHAQQELTDIVFVELPEVGATFGAGDEIATVESVKTASPIYTPVGGEVIEVNTALEDNPAKVNDEPYEGGWFFKLRLSNASEADALLDAGQYKAQIGS